MPVTRPSRLLERTGSTPLPLRRAALAAAWALAAWALAGCGRFGLDPSPRRDAGPADADADTDVDADTDADVDTDADADTDSDADVGADAEVDAEEPLVVDEVWVVATDLDDGELDATRAFGDSGYAPQGERSCWTYMGGYDPTTTPGTSETMSFFRFALPSAIPAGATIRGAQLRLYGRDVWFWRPADHTLSVVAERSADAEPISSYADMPGYPGGRSIGAARVLWGAGGGAPLEWALGGWNPSPDLSPLVQELVDEQGGLAAGAHVQLFLWREAATDDGEVAAEDYCSPDANHAELSLSWAA
jgi:hypothetical protein